MESFIGSELTDAECDAIALTRFSKALFDGESELQQKCFFDYRHMHPTKRTYLFASIYMKRYKELYERFIDMESDHIYGLSRPNDPLDNEPPRNKKAKLRTPTCLWKARQVCDGIGMPYSFYIGRSLTKLFQDRYYKAMLGTTATNKTRLNIQASGLYSSDIIEHVIDSWEEHLRARMVWSDNVRLCFTESESNGQSKPHIYKLVYERFVLDQIMTKVHKEFSLQTALSKRAIRTIVFNKMVDKYV